jgi:hypothetical protein
MQPQGVPLKDLMAKFVKPAPRKAPLTRSYAAARAAVKRK